LVLGIVPALHEEMNVFHMETDVCGGRFELTELYMYIIHSSQRALKDSFKVHANLQCIALA